MARDDRRRHAREGVPRFHTSPPASCALRLLDGFRLDLDGRECLLPGGARKVIALVALSGRPNRASVAGRLWPEAADRRALGRLRSVLHSIQTLCPGIIRCQNDLLALTNQVRVDFDEVTAWSLALLAETNGDRPPAALALPDAVWRSELLPGWYEDWVLTEREQFHQLRMHALEMLAARLVKEGRYGEALYAAHSAVRSAPLRESAYRVVIRIHLAEGNLSEALRQYETYRALLRAELNVDPSPLMRALLDPASEDPAAESWTPTTPPKHARRSEHRADPAGADGPPKPWSAGWTAPFRVRR